MTRIRQDDLTKSITDALQHFSYYHPVDFSTNMARAYEMEQAQAAKDAIAQVLINSRMAAEGHRPMCQDTGIITIFLYIGMDLLWDQATTSIDDMVNAGVRRAYTDLDNPLRESMVSDPIGARTNTQDRVD
jgi:fumarate hydratase, class I